MSSTSENLPADSRAEADGGELGPCMRALPTDRQRMFVSALFDVKPGIGCQIAAAKMAGYGTPNSSAKSLSAIASRVIHDDKVQAAILEEGQRRFRGTAPRALHALGRLLENERSPHHAKAIALTLDRFLPVATTINVEHRHAVSTTSIDKVLERIAQLAIAAGLNPKLLPPVIEGEAEHHD